MRTKLLLKIIVLVMMCIHGIGAYAQKHILIDTFIFNARTNEKAIILQNKIGERREYLFNDDNKLASENYTYLSNSFESNENGTLRYHVDSSIYKNDTIYFTSNTYILTESNGEYIRTFEEQESSVLLNIDQLKDYGDSVVWYSGMNKDPDKNVLTKNNGQFTQYSYQFDALDRKFGYNWMVKYEKQKTFLIDTTHSRICINYDIIILNYSKLGRPKSVYLYDWLFVSYKEPDVMKHIMSKRQIKKPLQIFEITYCKTGSCIADKALEAKTIKAYLKFNEKHYGYY